MTTKGVTQAFDEYQKARMGFASNVADLAAKPLLVECLRSYQAIELLTPLLNDPIPKIQQCASLALGRIISNSLDAAFDANKCDVLPQLLKNFDKRSKPYKKSAMLVLRGLAKYSGEMASIVSRMGGLDAALLCLEDFDAGVKEAGAWVVGYISRHNEKLAYLVSQAGAVGLLKLCLQEVEICLKQVAISALSDIAKHNQELARSVIDHGCLPLLVKYLANHDAKLKKAILCCLSHIAGHTVDLAETVIEAEAFPSALYHMAHPDNGVRRAAACVTREVVKHNPELAGLVVNSGGIEALLETIICSDETVKLPALMALGYIASQGENLASNIINCEAVPTLSNLLKTESDLNLLAITVWVLGQIGKYSSEHTKPLAVEGVYNEIIKLYLREDANEELQLKCSQACKLLLQKCTFTPALEALMFEAPSEIIKYVLGQFAKILPNDPAARRKFITSGCLEKVQQLRPTPGTTLFEYITLINYCFPEEIIRYYSPGYSESLLEKVEQYTPQVPPVFTQNIIRQDPEDTGTCGIPILEECQI